MDSFQSACKVLQERVFEANLALHHSGLVVSTFGNVSEKHIFDDRVIIGIKPSGVQYARLRPEDIVLLNEHGEIVLGSLRPSTDTPTHLGLYCHLPDISGVTHTHSPYASAWAQAELDIPPLGTTHADYAKNAIPCTEPLSDQRIATNYEANTALAIVERLKAVDNLDSKMVLVRGHGPFTMGADGMDSVENAVLLEEIAKIAYLTKMLNPNSSFLSRVLHDKHYDRKHGTKKYYGQN
jgi:L-ribulose-5-phosphate 4-epimerase